MIAVQEELDWEIYQLYGLIDEDLTYSGDMPDWRLGSERSRSLWLVLSGGRGGDRLVHPAWVDADHGDSGAGRRLPRTCTATA